MTEGLTPQQRVEVDAAVHDAYMRDDGTTRSKSEAVEEFDGILANAVQKHRGWAGVLLDEWRRAGMSAFIHRRWRELEGRFGFIHEGRRRERTLRRGTQIRDLETGRETWIQDPLLDFTATQLERAIAQCVQRIDEERANIAMYRALLDLLEKTAESTVRGALEKIGVSLEEYLASRDAA